MATAAEVAALRANTGQNTEDVYTDPELAVIIDNLGSVEAASAEVWGQLAAEYAKLVDTKEAGAEHRWSSLLTNALKMADRFTEKANASVVDTTNRPKTIAITRV